ncbi:sugar phosphate permease [Arthrobacter globiformis]|nr:sugar phosphate permease [Arthrobacter globiformis]
MLMCIHFLLTGYLFAWVLIGIDPGPGRSPYPFRLIMLLATMAFHAFFGLSLMHGTEILAPQWWASLQLTTDQEALLADQQRGGAIAWGVGEIPTVSGILGVCLPAALLVGAYVVQMVAPLGELAMFMFPGAIAAVLLVAFLFILKDKRLMPGDKPAWSFRELASSFYINPRKAPDFTWAWISRFLFVLGQSFLLTYQAFYLLNRIKVSEADLPNEIFIATLVSSVLWIVSSVVGGRLSDASGRRKIFTLVSAAVYGIGLLVVAMSTEMTLFLVAMAITGIGIGIYFAVDLALVADVLPDPKNAAKDLGVFNIASALPQSIAPAIAPTILLVGGGNYSSLFMIAGVCTILGAFAILKVKKVR